MMLYRIIRIVAAFSGLLLVHVLVSTSHATVTYPLTPNSITKEVKDRGAKLVVRELYGDSKAWSKILTEIASGKNSRIDIAIVLRNGSDAGSASMLRDSVFEALNKNPKYVLLNALNAYSIGSICSGRDDPLPTYQAASAEAEETIRKVSAINDINLKGLKDQCLKHLELNKANMRRFFGVGDN